MFTDGFKLSQPKNTILNFSRFGRIERTYTRYSNTGRMRFPRAKIIDVNLESEQFQTEHIFRFCCFILYTRPKNNDEKSAV